MTDRISHRTDDQSAQVAAARLVRTLYRGTEAMRSAGALYLPKNESESEAAYQSRLKRTFLFNAVRKTVADMVGKIMRKPITLGADAPRQLVDLAENIDLAGRDINQFARDLLVDGMQTGVTFIVVDMPPATKRDDGRTPTLKDEQIAGHRPYLKMFTVEQLLGFQSKMIGGVETLTQVRFTETVLEPDGKYHSTAIEQIRVLELGRFETWRRVEGTKDDWRLHENGPVSIGVVPVVPVYMRRKDFMSGASPLADLADLNVAHWQSSSDQRNILHVARVPILFGAGFTVDDPIAVGADQMVRTSNVNAKLDYVEHSGAALDAGDKDLDNLERQMQNFGLQLLVPTPGQTATGEIRDDAKENSPLAAMALSMQDSLEHAFSLMAEFIGLGKDAGGSLAVNTDFGASASPADLQHLITARGAGEISRDTLWTEMKRRGLLSDSFDPAVEHHRLDSEAPTLGRARRPDILDLDDDHSGHNH